MGSPSTYYKQLLQNFVCYLAVEEDDFILARQLLDENSVEKLENYITGKKDQFSKELFYYDAGMVSQLILDNADKVGCDAFNAAAGGVAEFEYFIGLKCA